MESKEELTKKFKLISMNDIDISTEEKPIIGTQALATCVGLILYSEKHKKAIVAHISSSHEHIFYNIFYLIFTNKLEDSIIKYGIIPGYYEEHYNVVKDLKTFFNNYPELFVSFSSDELIKCFNIDKETFSKEFAFDSRSGKFVTDKVLFGTEYLNLNNKAK